MMVREQALLRLNFPEFFKGFIPEILSSLAFGGISLVFLYHFDAFISVSFEISSAPAYLMT